MMSFADKVVLVTGGAGGIGHASAKTFSKAGAHVVIVDLDEENGRALESEIQSEGRQALFVRADVSRSEDVQAYVRAAVTAFGRIDVFLNNAAWEGEVRSLVDYPDDTFDRVISINVRGAFLGMKHVLPVMYRQKAGAVVNTASLAAHVGSPGLVAYTASKHALLGMTKTAALEGAKFGVRVNAVCPGAVDTRMLHSLAQAKEPGQAGEAMRRYAEDAPNGRLATPQDIANVMLFLASDLSGHVSGQSIRIDGGRIMI